MVLGFQPESRVSLTEESLRLLDKKLLEIFEKSVEETAVEIDKDLSDIVRTWSRKPRFRFVLDVERGSYSATLTTDSDVWRWLDLGTEPHYIPGSKDNKLSFPGWGRNRRDRRGNYPDTYQPATRPGSFQSGDLNYLGDRFAVSQSEIYHPGVEARNWSVMLTEKHSAEFARNMRRNFALLEL